MAASYSAQRSQMMPYLVGNKIYGGGRSMPTIGPVDKLGYAERDANMRARRNALLRQMRSRLQGKSMSADSLRVVK